jgi:hypothetical protein
MDLLHANRSLLSVVLFALLVLGALTCPPDIFAAEPTGQQVQAPAAPTTPPSAQIPREVRIASYSREAVGLVAGVFCLLAVLFVILLWWAGRLERASYLGTLYRDTVEDLEYRRLIAPLTEKFADNEYAEDVVQDKDWLTANPQPDFPEGRQFSRIRRYRYRPPIIPPSEFQPSRPDEIGESFLRGPPRPGPPTPEEQERERQREQERERQREQARQQREQLRQQYEDWEKK